MLDAIIGATILALVTVFAGPLVQRLTAPAPPTTPDLATTPNITVQKGTIYTPGLTTGPGTAANSLWVDNIPCTSAGEEHQWRPYGRDGHYIDAIICNSGDMYLQLASKLPAAVADIRRTIVSRDRLLEAFGTGGGTNGETVAGQVSGPATPIALPGFAPRPMPALAPQAQFRLVQPCQNCVICARPLPDGRGLYRRVVANGLCFDQIIDTWNGAVVSNAPVNCQVPPPC